MERNYITFVTLISLRYFLLTGLAYLVFYKILHLKMVQLKIQKKYPKHKDFIRELKHSLYTVLIFAGYGFLVFNTNLKQHTKIYADFDEHSIGYFLLSVFLAVLIHDTYFYFIHRLMHHKTIYRQVHLLHHKSTNPNPFSAYSFHPFEAVIEGSVLLLIVFLLPIHKLGIGLFLAFMIIFNIYGHLGYEIIPKRISNSRFGKWINTATNHNLHHEKSSGNYGLYFTFWDRIFKTLKK